MTRDLKRQLILVKLIQNTKARIELYTRTVSIDKQKSHVVRYIMLLIFFMNTEQPRLQVPP